jgi:hypothetical protein
MPEQPAGLNPESMEPPECLEEWISGSPLRVVRNDGCLFSLVMAGPDPAINVFLFLHRHEGLGSQYLKSERRS